MLTLAELSFRFPDMKYEEMGCILSPDIKQSFISTEIKPGGSLPQGIVKINTSLKKWTND